jgi:hypothetical protein
MIMKKNPPEWGAIRKQIAMINQEIVQRVEANYRERQQIFLLQTGHYISYVIFRKYIS